MSQKVFLCIIMFLNYKTRLINFRVGLNALNGKDKATTLDDGAGIV